MKRFRLCLRPCSKQGTAHVASVAHAAHAGDDDVDDASDAAPISSGGPLRMKNDPVEIVFIPFMKSSDIGRGDTVLLNNMHVIQGGR